MYFTPILNTDYYKCAHHAQYNPNITKIVSYYTPRMSRTDEDYLIMFGLQYYIKEYLIKQFNCNFFNIDKDIAVKKYARMMKNTFSSSQADTSRWEKLWDLQYLPLEIKAIAEGTKVPIHCPMIEISNTDPEFAWLVNFIETPMSCTLWHAMASANVGYKYRQIVNKYYDKTVDDNIPKHTAIGDYSMRGQESIESAAKSSAAFLLSFSKTATIPAVEFLEEYYNCNIENEIVGSGAIGTEHSVMCSSFAIDGDEKTQVLRLINEIYPNDNFTIVADSYDFWNFVANILTDDDVKNAIIEHEKRGYFVGIRPDSGNPVDILCGELDNKENKQIEMYSPEWYKHLGLVESLHAIFGGYLNTKCYAINRGVKAVYGDSITYERAEQIYDRLEKKGFASNNVVLGCGSYSMQSVGGNDPLTRDTYGIAIKTTYCEIYEHINNIVDMIRGIRVFKNPKTDSGNFKQSQQGLCYVYRDNKDNGKIKFEDKIDILDNRYENSLLETVFYDGEMFIEYSLKEVRQNLFEEDKF